jgi:predicted double-glycine peptidase
MLRRLGVETSERATARAAFSYSGGTEAWYLARYVRSRGLSPRFDFHSTFSRTTGFPALVGVRLGGTGHFIAILEVRGGQVTFADPLFGERRLSLPQFQRRYEFTGFHMVVSKNGSG